MANAGSEEVPRGALAQRTIQQFGTSSLTAVRVDGREDTLEDVHELDEIKDMNLDETEIASEAGRGSDDEALDSDPGTPQEEVPEDVNEADETKDMNLDETENSLEEERGSDDEALDSDPGTPQEEVPEDVNEADETKDMNLDETENSLEEERGSDDEALDSDPGTPQEEAPEDINESDETKDMNVDGTENDLEVLGDGQEEGETSLDSEKFVAPFPITRVKRIIKLDKDVRLVSSDAIALIAQATALFVQNLSSASLTVMLQTKRKTIRGPDVILAARSTRQFRECLGNDLATLLEESYEDTANGEDGPVEKEHGTDGEPVKKKPQQQKSAKKHQLAPPPGSRPITNFFKA